MPSPQGLAGRQRRNAGLPGPVATVLEPPIEPISGAEQGVGLGGLLGVVGGGVAAEHGWVGVAEEELDVDLTGLLFDGPGGEGVAKAVRVDLGDGGLFAQALKVGLSRVQHSLDDLGAGAGRAESPLRCR